MSSARIVIPRAAAVAAAAAAAEPTDAAAGVLMVWASTVLAARAVEDLGRGGPGDAARRLAGRGLEMAWKQIAVDVVGLNVRIRMGAGRTFAAGAAVGLPTPLGLAGRTRSEAARWCRETERLLADTARSTRSGFRVEGVGPEVAAAVEDLDPDADERDWRAMSAAACPDLVEEVRVEGADGYLRTLRHLIAGTNAAAADRRLAAQRLAVLEDSAVVGGHLPSPFTDVVEMLSDVVADGTAMTPSLRSLSGEAVAWAGERVHKHFIAETMTACMAGLGYLQEDESGIEHSAEVRLRRPDWNGEHSAEMWLDRGGVLHGRLSRETVVHGETALRERSRCAEFTRDVGVLGRRLGAEAVTDEDAPRDPERYEPVRGRARRSRTGA